MNTDILFALTAFAFAASITPGPNNLMLLTSGANFGWKRTTPHMLGVNSGFIFMMILMGAGLAPIMVGVPIIQTVLKTASVAFLAYLAFRIATAAPVFNDGTQAQGKPISFLQAALFQWVNPKAWVMAISAMSVYNPWPGSIVGVLLVAAIFGMVNFPSIGCWVFMGTQMRRVLNVPWKLRAFNICAAILLLGSLYPILFPKI